VDNLGPIALRQAACQFTRLAPRFDERQPPRKLSRPASKVIDLIQPFLKGGKIGLFGWRRRRQDRCHMETYHNVAKQSTAAFPRHSAGVGERTREGNRLG